MGDMSEIRALIVIGVFTSVLIFMILQIPSGLLPDAQSGTGDLRNVDYLDYWDAGTFRDYVDINETVIDPNVALATWRTLPDFASLTLFSQQLDDGDASGEIEFGGYEELWLLSKYSANASEGRIYIAYPSQRFLGGGWVTRWGWSEFYFANGTSVSHNSASYGENRALNKFILEDYFEEELSDGNPQNLTSFKVKMNYEDRQIVWFDLHFAFNTSIYGDPQFAWDSAGGDAVPDELYVMTGINFDQTKTSYDAYQIIEALLFFNIPQILAGTPLFIGYILSVIIWIPMVYIAFILILRAIGGVFGGGA